MLSWSRTRPPDPSHEGTRGSAGTGAPGIEPEPVEPGLGSSRMGLGVRGPVRGGLSPSSIHLPLSPAQPCPGQPQLGAEGRLGGKTPEPQLRPGHALEGRGKAPTGGLVPRARWRRGGCPSYVAAPQPFPGSPTVHSGGTWHPEGTPLPQPPQDAKGHQAVPSHELACAHPMLSVQGCLSCSGNITATCLCHRGRSVPELSGSRHSGGQGMRAKLWAGRCQSLPLPLGRKWARAAP